MVKTIKRGDVVTFIRDETTGKIFAVRFRKKDGSIRDMVCRLGVKKGVKGVGRKGWVKGDTVANYGLLGVYDMNKIEKVGEKGAFRMVNVETLINIKVNGVEYVVVD